MTNEGEILASALPIYTTIGKPFSVLEIDVHPDRKRIWATLLALSDYLEEDVQLMMGDIEKEKESSLESGWDDGHSAGYEKAEKDYEDGYTAGYHEGYEDGVKDGKAQLQP